MHHVRLKQTIVQTYSIRRNNLPSSWLHDLKRFSGPMLLEPLHTVQR